MNIINCKDAKPVHKGVYRTFTKDELLSEQDNKKMIPFYQYFDGKSWSKASRAEPKFAFEFRGEKDLEFSIVAWQGNSEPPVGKWHKGTVKPVHVGVYERIFEGGLKTYSKWDGKHWLAWNTTVEGANNGIIPSSRQDMPWRGLQYDIR